MIKHNKILLLFHGRIKGVLKTGTLLLSFLILSCSGNNSYSSNKSDLKTGSITRYAEKLLIEKNDSFTVVTIRDPWQGAKDVLQQWYLVPEGISVPDADPATVIRVPVRKIICMSTTHLAMIRALNEERSLAGASGTDFIYDSTLKVLAERGHIREVGYDDNLNKELIASIDPDLVMVYGVGGESAAYTGKLAEMGIKVLYNADYLEEEPLGKAEWIQLFGALYGREDMADSIFLHTENEYNRLKEEIAGKSYPRPGVLLGLPYRDTWFISPGNSYISRLISDAGGDYLWKDTDSDQSMPYGIENVYTKALFADFWINPGSATGIDEIISLDKRLAGLKCVREGNVFNNNKRSNNNGGNDYWEKGAMNPHLILKDIAAILNPYPDYERELVYYRKLYTDR